MDITEISILHHAGIMLMGLWLLSSFNWCHPVAYFLALIYLYLVHERYVIRLRKKLQFEERKQANQRRVLSDSETVRWLNHAIENIWPICMEQIASQKILLPIIPWFLEKYKPWTAKEALVQHLYMGRNPPLLTEVRVLRQNNDDHLVLELGINFLTADDMSAILAVKLRKRLGFGMTAKLHITGMHVEGKVLVGVKFLRTWPFLGRVRVCFAEPPYFQMTVKPIFTHGLDVTELPGIAGWLDKLLSIAFEQTLVEPNMLVVDVEKFVSPQQEPWFSVDEKDAVAYVKVEVIEGSDMKPSDLNGLADPYVKGHLGGYRFRTKIQRKTLTPKWQEEFKIPIITWESSNMLVVEVRDKDRFYDDILGDCLINISDLRDGQKHDMWLPLQNVKMGRLHLAITVVEDKGKEQEVEITCDPKTVDIEERKDSSANETTNKQNSFSSVSSEKPSKVEDNYEPIDVEGQKETGIWVHHPGSEVSRTWEPRKGRNRRLDTEIHGECNDVSGNGKSGTLDNDYSSPDSNEEKHPMRAVKKGLHKIGSVLRRSRKKDDQSGFTGEDVIPSPHDNIRSINAKEGVGVKFVMEDNIGGFPTGKIQVDHEAHRDGASSEGSGSESPAKKEHVKDMARNILKSARGIKHALSCKSRRHRANASVPPERENSHESDSSDADSESLPVQSPKDGRIPVVSQAMPSPITTSADPKTIVVHTVQSNTPVDNEVPIKKVIVEEPKKNVGHPDMPKDDSVAGLEPKDDDIKEMVADERDISLSK